MRLIDDVPANSGDFPTFCLTKTERVRMAVRLYPTQSGLDGWMWTEKNGHISGGSSSSGSRL